MDSHISYINDKSMPYLSRELYKRVLQTAKDILTFRRHTFSHKQTFKPIDLVIFQPVVIMFLLYEGYGGALYRRRDNICGSPIESRDDNGAA